MVANFDFGCLADILGTHIGFLEADWEANRFTHTGEIVDEPLHFCLGVFCQGSIVSEEHVMHKYSFHFGLDAEVSYVEEFTVGAGMKVHTVSGGVKGMGQEKRRTDSEKCWG